MLIYLLEELVPPSYKLALGLVLDEIEFVVSPAVLDLHEEVFQDELTTCLIQDVLHILVIFDQICMPQVRDVQVVEADIFNLQLLQEILPVTRLHCLGLELT